MKGSIQTITSLTMRCDTICCDVMQFSETTKIAVYIFETRISFVVEICILQHGSLAEEWRLMMSPASHLNPYKKSADIPIYWQRTQKSQHCKIVEVLFFVRSYPHVRAGFVIAAMLDANKGMYEWLSRLYNTMVSPRSRMINNNPIINQIDTVLNIKTTWCNDTSSDPFAFFLTSKSIIQIIVSRSMFVVLIVVVITIPIPTIP